MALSPEQQQWVTDTGRQSFHWAQIPEAYRQIPGISDWANDPNIDPGAKVQEYLGAQRQSNPNLAQSDADALRTVGGQPAPAQAPAQSPAQQWNAQPTPIGQTQDAFISLLMQRAGQDTNVDRNSPQVRQQVDPFVAQQERAKRNYLADLAEKQGPNANLGAETRMANERFGQQAGLFEGEVVGRLMQDRLQERMQMLQLWGSVMSADQRMALEREIAHLSDQARSADRSQQGDQFLRELALREWTLGNQFDLGWAGLGG